MTSRYRIKRRLWVNYFEWDYANDGPCPVVPGPLTADMRRLGVASRELRRIFGSLGADERLVACGLFPEYFEDLLAGVIRPMLTEEAYIMKCIGKPSDVYLKILVTLRAMAGHRHPVRVTGTCRWARLPAYHFRKTPAR